MTSNENLNSRPRSRPRPIRCLFLGPPCVGKGTQARLLIQQHHEQEANHHDSGKFVLISSGDLLRLHTNNGSGKSDNKNGSSGTDVNNNNNDSSSGRSTSPTTATATTSPVAVAFTRKNLAPLVLELLEQELSKLDRDRDGFILDVSLRSTNEVKQVDSILHKLGLSLDCVIQFRMDDLESTDASTRDLALREIAKRGAGRLVHLPSGRTYHPIYAPPKVEGKDDITGDDLVQRNDDSATNDGFEAMQRRLELYHRGSVPVIEYLRAKGRQLYNDDEHGAPLVRELHLKVDHTIQETNTALSEIIRSSPLRPNYEPGSAPAVVVVERRAPPDASTIEQLLQNEETAALMVLAGTTTCKKLVVGDPEYMRIVQQVLQVSGSRKKDASFPGRQVAYLGREALAEVLRHIHNAVYSMKADGTRYLAWIESSSPAPTTKEEDTAAATATTANVYLINRKMEVFKFSTSGILAQFANSLLDGELVVETQQTTTKDANNNNNNTSVKDLLRFRFIICDALNVRGQDKVQMRLVDRLAEVNAFFFSNKQQQRGGSIDDGEEEKYDENRLAVSPQRYYPLKNLTTVQALMSDPPLPYATDGLIIQSAVYPPYYRHGFDRNCYKWKPMEKDTVDFQINITTITVVRNKDDKHDDLASDTEQRVVVELHVFDHVTRKPQPFAYLALGDEFHHDESELAAKFGVTRLQGAIVECYWNKDVETLTPTPVDGPVASPSSSAAADAKTTDESDETSKKPLIYRLEKTKGGWCIARLRTDKSTPNVRWVVESIVKNAKEDRITRDELIAGICAEAAASSAASAASTTATKTTTTTTTTTMTRQRPSPITPATTSARARWTATSDDTSSSSAAAESDDGWRTVSNRHSSSSGSTQHHHQQQRQPRGGAAQRGGSNNGHRHGNNNHSNNTTRCASASLARRSNGSSDDWRKK